ncbi:MAG: hypothetical protein IKN42_05305 [Elusimicrobia bacterium]|nr:hypothetical protein [Elusimicrobiota bacterium]
MNFKQIRTLVILGIICYFLYSITIVQLNTILIDLNSQLTDLKEQEQIIKSENSSILSNIKSLLSMENLNKIAKEKNFTSNKGRIVVLNIEDDQAKEE